MPAPETVVLCAATGVTLVAGGIFSILHPRATVFGPTVWRGPSTRPSVALTFDDGPEPDYTERIAKILDAHEARATFFCIGQRLERHPFTATALLRAGHQLENHTYSHGLGRDLFSGARLQKDLQRCADVLANLSGGASKYYRPAVGIRNPAVHAAARALGLTVVTWTHTARDGLFALSPRRAAGLAERVDAGSIVALHDGNLHGRRLLREQTILQLPLLLNRLTERGFAFETLSQLLAR